MHTVEGEERFKEFDWIRFINGYSTNAREMTLEFFWSIKGIWKSKVWRN